MVLQLTVHDQLTAFPASDAGNQVQNQRNPDKQRQELTRRWLSIGLSQRQKRRTPLPRPQRQKRRSAPCQCVPQLSCTRQSAPITAPLALSGIRAWVLARSLLIAHCLVTSRRGRGNGRSVVEYHPPPVHLRPAADPVLRCKYRQGQQRGHGHSRGTFAPTERELLNQGPAAKRPCRIGSIFKRPVL